METIIIILLCFISVAFAASPFISGQKEWISSGTDKRLDKKITEKESFLQAIKDVEFEFAEGKLTEKDYHELRDFYKEKAIQSTKAIDTLKSDASTAKADINENKA
ncbi:MAG: hypothetical protein RQ824_06960 [bacterium]|nr:hypothetical protein [bacterium]